MINASFSFSYFFDGGTIITHTYSISFEKTISDKSSLILKDKIVSLLSLL